jgi:uncharacterized protein YndB with AHSA1/START domain
VSNQEAEVLEVERRVRALPETVFAFFTDPAKMTRWVGTDVMVDARPGGAFRINVTSRHTARGHFVEVTPYRRIVMAWGWDDGPFTPGSTRVEVDFIPDGDATIIRLRHSGLDADGRTSHRQGWEHYLDRLVIAGSGEDAGVDPWFDSPPA